MMETREVGHEVGHIEAANYCSWVARRMWRSATSSFASVPAPDSSTAERGFTVAEVLVALVILTIGLLGAGVALTVVAGGTASGVSSGQTAISQGYFASKGVELAQDRMEQVKRIPYSISGGDSFGADPIPTGFGDESPVTGYPQFNRTVRVTTGSPAANMKTVTVTVTYRVPTATGPINGRALLSTLVAARP